MHNKNEHYHVGLPSLGLVFVGSHLTQELFSSAAAAMACTTSFAASTAASAMACVIAAWSVSILYDFLAWWYLLVLAETACMSLSISTAYVYLVETFTSDIM